MQMREMNFILHWPTNNPFQGAAPSTMTCKETSAPETSPYTACLDDNAGNKTKQNILYLSTDRGEPREVPGECLADLRGANVSTWLVTCKTANCFHDTCFLNRSHSGHFSLCCKEAGEPFHNPTILCRHNRATMVENK